MSAVSASHEHAARPDDALNVAALRADTRRQALGFLALLSPGLFLVFAVIIVPVGWLFWLYLRRHASHVTAPFRFTFFKNFSNFLKFKINVSRF